MIIAKRIIEKKFEKQLCSIDCLQISENFIWHMKTCLITGGSRGIGAATAVKFAKEEYTVILNYNRSAFQAENLCNTLRAEGCDVHLLHADLSDLSQLKQMFAETEKYFKKLNVLVNNAGVALSKQLQDVSESEYDSIFAVNAKATFFCCREALPLLAKTGGTIVNVASIWGLYGSSCESVYSMSKHAVVGLTRSLSEELCPMGINVNCVCPPIVETDMCAHLTERDIADFCTERNTRLYTPQQVAEDIFSLGTCGESGKILLEK